MSKELQKLSLKQFNKRIQEVKQFKNIDLDVIEKMQEHLKKQNLKYWNVFDIWDLNTCYTIDTIEDRVHDYNNNTIYKNDRYLLLDNHFGN